MYKHVPLLTINEPDMFLYGHALTILTDVYYYVPAAIWNSIGPAAIWNVPAAICCLAAYYVLLCTTEQ